MCMYVRMIVGINFVVCMVSHCVCVIINNAVVKIFIIRTVCAYVYMYLTVWSIYCTNKFIIKIITAKYLL